MLNECKLYIDKNKPGFVCVMYTIVGTLLCAALFGFLRVFPRAEVVLCRFLKKKSKGVCNA